jgi:hypothetical protein
MRLAAKKADKLLCCACPPIVEWKYMERQDNVSKSNGIEATKGSSLRLYLIIAILGLITAIISLSGAVLSFWKSVGIIRSDVNEVRISVKYIEKEVLSGRFVVTFPVDGATVDFIDIIRGRTPFPKMNHYTVVTPLKTGDDWIQGSAKVYGDNSWIGQARFGTGEAGVGEEFLVRAIATKSTLSPGALTNVPKDAVFSESITVIRK